MALTCVVSDADKDVDILFTECSTFHLFFFKFLKLYLLYAFVSRE